MNGSKTIIESPNRSARTVSGSIASVLMKISSTPRIITRGFVIQPTNSVRATPHIFRSFSRTTVHPLPVYYDKRCEHQRRRDPENKPSDEPCFIVHPEYSVGIYCICKGYCVLVRAHCRKCVLRYLLMELFQTVFQEKRDTHYEIFIVQNACQKHCRNAPECAEKEHL